MSFLELPVLHFTPCSKNSTLTFGDVCKLVVPVAWTFMAVLVVILYLVIPEEPMWSGAAVVALVALSGLGVCLATYGFHRQASTFAIESNCPRAIHVGGTPEGQKILVETQMGMRRRALRLHTALSILFGVASVVLAIFFGTYAPNHDQCAHENCGVDLVLCGVSLFASAIWTAVTHLGWRDYRRVSQSQKKPKSSMTLDSSWDKTNKSKDEDEEAV